MRPGDEGVPSIQFNRGGPLKMIETNRRLLRRWTWMPSLAFALTVAAVIPAQAQDTILHSFTGAPSDGNIATGALVEVGASLYGTTYAGGASDGGSFYTMSLDGSGFTILHSFTTGSTDGGEPASTPILSGSTFYGTASRGGNSGSGFSTLGVIYSINADGTGFNLLHKFSLVDGTSPWGGLTQSGATLFGTTSSGGISNNGTIYKMGMDGSGFTVLHTFNGGTEGGDPEGGLTLAGSYLYGITGPGTGTGYGDIFRIGVDGTGFSVLHTFSGQIGFGGTGVGSLVISGSKVYGVTSFGANNDKGTVFSMNLDGTGYTVLHNFAGGPNDGNDPSSSLLLVGTTLYGTTTSGGTGNDGTVFSMDINGGGFRILDSFQGGLTDGASPGGTLTLSNDGSLLYGTTRQGGNGLGVAFAVSIAVPEPDVWLSLYTGAAGVFLLRRRRVRGTARSSIVNNR